MKGSAASQGARPSAWNLLADLKAFFPRPWLPLKPEPLWGPQTPIVRHSCPSSILAELWMDYSWQRGLLVVAMDIGDLGLEVGGGVQCHWSRLG